MKPKRDLFIFLGALTILRWILAAHVELSPDESYYYMWSQRLDWAFYSKGPGVSLAIRLGTMIFGATEFGVRFLSPIFALGTSLLIFSFAKKLYGESAAIWTTLMINCIPIFQAGGLLMTIDPLSIFFWTAAIYAFWNALEKSPRFTFFWPLAGLLIGLGFLSKYTNAMQLLSVLAVLGLTKKWRGEFRRSGLYLLLAVFAVCALPPVIWNSQHDWVTVAHLSSRGGLDQGFSFHPTEFLGFLAAHFGVYSPLIFAGLLTALWWSRRQSGTDFKSPFLLWFAAPLLVMYFALSFKNAGEANWTAPAFVSLGILAVAMWHARAQSKPLLKKFAGTALAVGIVLGLLLIGTDALRAIGIPWSYERDPTTRLRGWKTTALAVHQLREKLEAENNRPLFLIGDKYQTAASLSFYLPDKKRVEGERHPLVYIPESAFPESEFAFWPRYDEFIAIPRDPNAPLPTTSEEESKLIAASPFTGRDALYISDHEENTMRTSLRNSFERIEPIALYEVGRRGDTVRKIWIFGCYNYRGLSL